MTTCFQELRKQAAAVLLDHPELEHHWTEDQDGSVVLHIPKTSSSGFDIQLISSDSYITLEAGGFHSHRDDPIDPKELTSSTLGLVRDLLSESMRLRVRYAGGKPYSWYLEARSRTGWETEEEMGLWFWNFFGKKSEVLFQNDQLPPRTDSDRILSI